MTRVEELAKVLRDLNEKLVQITSSSTYEPFDADELRARAALAWMAELVPHVEVYSDFISTLTIVDEHADPRDKKKCAALRGRCAWEGEK